MIGAGNAAHDRRGPGQVLLQERVDLPARLAGQRRVRAVEAVAARRILVDLVLEALARRLELRDQVLHLEDVHVPVVGRRVHQQGCPELFGIPGR